MLLDLRKLFFDKSCIHCKEPLILNEEVLCFTCKNDLKTFEMNEKTTLYACNSIHSVISLYSYYRNSPVQSIISSFKYDGLKHVAVWIAHEIQERNSFSSFDCISFVPMHRKKRKERGFNQAEEIAKQLSKITGVPMINLLYRSSHISSQTKESKYNRYKRSSQIYKSSSTPIKDNSQVLLVDDVFTSGSTLISCANEIKRSHQVNITALTFAFAPEEQNL